MTVGRKAQRTSQVRAHVRQTLRKQPSGGSGGGEKLTLLVLSSVEDLVSHRNLVVDVEDGGLVGNSASLDGLAAGLLVLKCAAQKRKGRGLLSPKPSKACKAN